MTGGTERPYWATLSPYLGAQVPDLARFYEQAGYAGVMVGQNWGPPWITLAAAAAVTDRVELLPGVAIAGARSPFETAMAALDLDRLSGGRAILGLGTSSRWINSSTFGVEIERPVEHLVDVVAAVRHIVAGAHTGLEPFDGRFWSADFAGFAPLPPPVRSDLPIWLGALRSRLTRIAGEIADGLLGHPLWGVDWYLDTVEPDVHAGLGRAGRSRDDFHLAAYLTCAPDPDRAAALADARASLAAYFAIAQYQGFYDARGVGDLARRVRALVDGGDVEGAARLVPDDVAAAFVVVGEPDEVRAEVERVWAVADSVLLSPPAWGVARRRMAAYGAALVGLGPDGSATPSA